MRFSSFGARLAAVLAATAAVVGVDWLLRSPDAAPAQAVWPVATGAVQTRQLERVAGGNIPMPPGTKAAHASTLIAMPSTSKAMVTAFWFSGERESGPQVQIAASQFDRATQSWSTARFVVNRHVLGKQLGFGVRRLGNPVVWRDAHQRLHLFVVATGWGGWAASRVVQLSQAGSSDDLQKLEFEPVRVLPLSWLWNTSHLVRNAPLDLADGGMVLPVHFELGIKYPLALRFDSAGNFLGMVRISARNHALQPTLLAATGQRWVTLMRDERSDGQIIAAESQDAGASWRDLPDLPLLNPDASVAGLALTPTEMLLAHNTSPGSRAELSLSASNDGLAWAGTRVLAQGGPEEEFSYPAMLWADDGLWVSYTVDRHHIDWQRFAVRKSGVKP
jgi:predicted neuraminidase